VRSRSAWEQEREVLIVSLDSSFVEARASQSLQAENLKFIPQFRLRDPLIEGIVNELSAEVVKESAADFSLTADNDYANSLAEVLTSHIIRDFTTQKPVANLRNGKLAPVKLRRATEFINDHLEEGITLMNIAEAVEMSPFHFARMFKQTTGFPPLQY